MIQQKFVDEISLNFPELFIIRKYVKIRFKDSGSPCYFLSSRGRKIKNITKIEHTGPFLLAYFVSFFYGVSRAKTDDLRNKYSGTSLKRTLTEQKFLSALERCPPWKGLN